MATERGMGRNSKKTSPITGKNYLLCIGIDKYQHWQVLSNAVKDAREFAEVLNLQYQFSEEHIFSLYDHEATEGKIYQALRDMKRRLAPHDNLVVYYSGHGHYDDEIDEGFWIPVDAEKDDESSFISNANIVKRINVLETQHTLLIVDSCFSGSLVVRKRNVLPDERFKSRRILASGRYETVSDGKEGENSPFSAGLLTFLRRNTSPRLDSTSVIKYVKDYVFAKANQHPVDGRIQNSADEGGEFVFHLQRDEEAVWKDVTSNNTIKEYRNYLASFPEGRYVAVANRKINELAEDDIWANAKINDNESAYEEYIRKFTPNGKYLTEARSQLDTLKEKRVARQQAQEEMAGREHQREQLRQQYEQTVNEAESLFKDRKLTKAREKYRLALTNHLPGFVPTQNYLEEQINLCQNNITFLQYYENGVAAMEDKNYRLAIEYYQEALKINSNEKVEQLIIHCQQHLKGGNKRAASATVDHQQRSYTTTTPQPVKTKSPVWMKILAGVGGVLIFIMILGLFAEDEPMQEPLGVYQDEIYQEEPEDDQTEITTTDRVDDDYQEETYTPPPAPEPESLPTEQLILGTWTVKAIEIMQGGVAYNAVEQDPTLAPYIGATYVFNNDYTVLLTLTTGYAEYLAYSALGNEIYVASAGFDIGTINRLDSHKLVATFPFTNFNGTFYVRYSLSR